MVFFTFFCSDDRAHWEFWIYSITKISCFCIYLNFQLHPHYLGTDGGSKNCERFHCQPFLCLVLFFSTFISVCLNLLITPISNFEIFLPILDTEKWLWKLNSHHVNWWRRWSSSLSFSTYFDSFRLVAEVPRFWPLGTNSSESYGQAIDHNDIGNKENDQVSNPILTLNKSINFIASVWVLSDGNT